MSAKAISDGSRWGFYGAPGDLITTPPPAPPWAPILNVDWGSVAPGAMTGTKFRTAMNDPLQPSSYSAYSRMSLVDGGERNQVLRINFTQGLANGAGEDCAMFSALDMSKYPGGFAAGKDRAVRMTDWMLYPTDFTFTPAAKTPGLGGNINGASNGQASGGNGTQSGMINGLSCRIMAYSAPGGNWSSGVPGFSSSLTGRNNRLAMYSYFNGMGDSFGLDLWDPDPGAPGHWPSTRVGTGTAARAMGDGLWHKRQLVMVPNTQVGGVWQADGKIRFYLDDVLIHHYDNVKWRSTPDLWVNKYWFHHFNGGSGTAYAPPADQYYLYDGPIVEWGLFDGWVFD